ncbi:DUF397 domain-containing protein [Streptomyces sp. SAS_270]|uniref:DUF397 domain-containing protein n=1 Tax=Streptomyces sp. SAS_270 TaxID=3412748 RepID=UPI00403D2F03
MPELHWQKSTYSQEASSCVNIATAPDGTIRLRESDDPEVTLSTTRTPLKNLIAAAKGPDGECGRQGAKRA